MIRLKDFLDRFHTRVERHAKALTPAAAIPPVAQPYFPGSAGRPFPVLARMIETYDRSGKVPPILYFGDSVVERVARGDHDTRTLGNMTADLLGGAAGLCCMSHSAYNTEIYFHFIRALDKMRSRPQAIILPVNLRSLSPQWHSNPLWQLHQEIAALQSFCADPCSPIPPIAEVIAEDGFFDDFEATPVRYPLHRFNTIGQFWNAIAAQPRTEEEAEARMRDIFIFHYTHPLEATHPKLLFLQQTLATLAKTNTTPLVYVTPINCDTGVRLVGPSFLDAIRSNVAVLEGAVRGAVAEHEPQFADWSTRLPQHMFFHDNLATEHLNEVGRREIAAAIANLVWSLNPSVVAKEASVATSQASQEQA